jgi:ABC-type polysaccharide/polyol phosphate transport system ATPase subunit
MVEAMDEELVVGTDVAVQAEGLVKTYTGRAGTVEAVRGVNLRIETGEVFGFLGPNGAGKSTTVRMLTTLPWPMVRRPKRAFSVVDLPAPFGPTMTPISPASRLIPTPLRIVAPP